MAELQRSRAGFGRNDVGPQLRHGAHRGALRPLRQPSRPRVSRRPAADASALLYQRGGDEFRAGLRSGRHIPVLRLTGLTPAPVGSNLHIIPHPQEELMLQETIENGVDLDTARRQARVDLAAAHRLAAMHGFNEGIFNHLTFRVPGANDRYYQIPFGLHWSEVTASCFMEIGYDGTQLAGEGEVERSAYCIHAPIHRRNEKAAAVFHTHMPFASA